jgi:5-histidylcysteine sulfoxide synthase
MSAVKPQHWAKYAIPYPNTSSCTKEEIVAYFNNAYDLDETLFTCVKDSQTFYENPDPLRLILLFYFVHTAAIFVNKLTLCRGIKNRINEEYEMMFETGVDEMSWDDVVSLSRIQGGQFRWPSLEEGIKYRAKAREIVLQLIQETPLELPITEESSGGFWWAILLGIEHERIHIETSSCLLRQLAVEKMLPIQGWNYAPTNATTDPGENKFISVKGDFVRVGKPRDFPMYGWCHEYGSTDICVPDFEAQQYLVTNREFLKFVQAGGYSNESYWSADGWKWKLYVNRQHPIWWVPVSDDHSECRFRYRALYSVIDMPLDWPVDITYHEAKAYTNWLGDHYRLPTEAEYWLMRALNQTHKKLEIQDELQHKYSVEDLPANLMQKYCSSSPVNFFPPNELGFYDIMGNVWQWCEDHFNGFDLHKTYTIYDDFSTPTFDGRHNVIVGGSWISSGSLASYWSRFGFRRHFMQHAGFRVVRSKSETPVRLIDVEVFILGLGEEANPTSVARVHPRSFSRSSNPQFYNDLPPVIYNNLLLNYGTPEQIDPNNVLRSTENQAEKLFGLIKSHWERESLATNRVVEIGCCSGYQSFRLSEFFDDVKAIDYSGRYVDICSKLANYKSYEYPYGLSKVPGVESFTAKIPSQARTDHVKFYQLTWLPVELGTKNDLVLVCNNYLNRVSSALAWLLRLRELTVVGGLLILQNSPTALDGSVIDLDFLKRYLLEHFVLLHHENLRHIERESDSRFTVSSSLFSVWKRVSKD